MALLYFHWWFILNLTLVAGQYYVLKGREAILTPSLPKAPDDILWKHNGDKVITFNTAEECVFGSYEGRVTLAWTTAELSIADVRYEDSGEYELEAFIGDRPHQSQFMLKVLDKVSVPVIRCEMSEESGDGHNRSATLLCSSESDTPEALTIKWNVDGESHQGQTLPIALGNKQDDITYSCTANNPLLQETSSFMAKDCYTERTAQTQDVLVPVLVLISLVILLVVCFLCFKFRNELKRGCTQICTNDCIKKQPIAAGQNRANVVKNEDEERVPFIESDIHRQETIMSPQRLPKQQYVDETPQGKVEDVRKVFENNGNTGTRTGGPAFPSRREPKPAHCPGPSVSRGERNLPNQEPNNVSNLEEAGDANPNHSNEDEYKDAQEEPSPSSETEVNQDLEPTPEKQESSRTMDSDEHHDHEEEEDDEQGKGVAGLSHSREADLDMSIEGPEQIEQESPKSESEESSEPPDSEKKSDEPHKDHEDDEQEKDDLSSSIESDPDETTKAPQQPVLEPQRHKQSSDENVQPTNEEQTGLTEQATPDHEVDKDPQKDSDEPVLMPPTAASEQTESSPQSSASPVHAAEPESKEQTNPDEESNTDTEKRVSSSDTLNHESVTSDNKEVEESGQSNDSHMSQSREQESPKSESEESSEPPDSEKKSDEPHKDHEDDEQEKDDLSSSIESGPDETTKAPQQPVLEPQRHKQSSDENVQPTNEEQTGLTEQATPDHEVDKDPQKDSDEPVLMPPTAASEQTGSGERADESTHPPASSWSQQNKQTKGTDGDLTEEDNPLHD